MDAKEEEEEEQAQLHQQQEQIQQQQEQQEQIQQQQEQQEQLHQQQEQIQQQQEQQEQLHQQQEQQEQLHQQQEQSELGDTKFWRIKPKHSRRRGLWSPDEDRRLVECISRLGHCRWSDVPKLAGLQRCGKSCRLRWINYLRPELNLTKFSAREEQLIIHLQALLGNKWSLISSRLPGRTDNQIKNHWNSVIKKRLSSMGLDPATHRPAAAQQSIVILPDSQQLYNSAFSSFNSCSSSWKLWNGAAAASPSPGNPSEATTTSSSSSSSRGNSSSSSSSSIYTAPILSKLPETTTSGISTTAEDTSSTDGMSFWRRLDDGMPQLEGPNYDSSSFWEELLSSSSELAL